MKRHLFALSILVAVAALPVAVAAQVTESDADAVVAAVDGHEIRRSDVAVAYERLPDRYKQFPFNVLFPQLIEQLINNHLMLVAGRAQNLGEDEKVRAQVREFEKFAIQQAYLERAIAEQVTEEEIRQVYDQTIGDSEGPEEVRASHILVETEETGRQLIEELAAGADFAELAREHSTGPSASRGGDLGYFTRDAMVEPFSEAAFALEVGTIGPDPVQTQFGWHVIKIFDKRSQPAPGYEESRGEIEDLLTREFITAHMAELRANAEIELFGLEGSTSGGAAE